MIKLAIYGSGNTAWTLSEAFHESTSVEQTIVARNESEGKALAQSRAANFVHPTDLNGDDFDIILLAISDISIPEIAARISGEKAVLAHVSGPSSIDELSSYSGETAVLYPLQTMTKGVSTPLTHIPILVEASSDKALTAIHTLAEEISKDVRIMNSERRLALHASAVFYNNFVNHINALGESIVSRNQIPFDLLIPLVSKTADLAKNQSSSSHQTGPAIRRDSITIEKHLSLLTKEEREIYKTLTESIQRKNEAEL